MNVRDAQVRHATNGWRGTIAHMADDDVEIVWQGAHLSQPVRRCYSRGDGRLIDDIEVYTGTQGWIPLARLVGTRELQQKLSTSGDDMQEDKKKHSPFKRKRKRGPGPRGRKDRKKGVWDCKRREKYWQVCTNKETGEVMDVFVDKAWKRKYNKDWRKFDKKRRKKKSKKKGKKAKE